MVTLTAGKTYTQQPDDRVLLKIARHSLTQALEAIERRSDIEAQSRMLNQRIRTGYQWIEQNSAFHPKYERALVLIQELQAQHNETRWQLRDVRVVIMGHALTFWQAFEGLQPADQQAIAGTYDISQIERPDGEEYRNMIMNWQHMGEEVEVPF